MIEEIPGIEKVIELNGGLPSFHDAEILTITFDREKVRIDVKVRLVKRIEEFEIDGKNLGKYRNIDISFIFANCWHIQLSGFNLQNVIQDLLITNGPDSIKYDVYFAQIYGADLRFYCGDIEIVDVTTFESESEMYWPSEERLNLLRAARKRQKFVS